MRRAPLRRANVACREAAVVRLTLRRHLRGVIEVEALRTPAPPLTNLKPWSHRVLTGSHKAIAREDSDFEVAGTVAQSVPSPED